MLSDGVVYAVFAWSLDFVRALLDRPLLAKLLLRPILGKYAYREFVGMVDALSKYWDGSLDCGYGLENATYHKDKIRRDWWNIE